MKNREIPFDQTLMCDDSLIWQMCNPSDEYILLYNCETNYFDFLKSNKCWTISFFNIMCETHSNVHSINGEQFEMWNSTKS